jgi:hypothetical protein
MASTIALTWPVLKARLLVTEDVPLVSSVIAVAEVPVAGAALNVEIFSGVFLQRLVDDRHDIVLGEVSELAGVRTDCSLPRLFIRGFCTSPCRSDYIFAAACSAGHSWADYSFVTA